jgi:hypothetical protein
MVGSVLGCLKWHLIMLNQVTRQDVVERHPLTLPSCMDGDLPDSGPGAFSFTPG